MLLLEQKILNVLLLFTHNKKYSGSTQLLPFTCVVFTDKNIVPCAI